MSQISSERNVFAITEKALKEELHQALFDRLSATIIADFVATIKPKVHEMVKSEVSKIVLDTATEFRDLSKMRDELHVYLSWTGEEPKLTVVGE